MWKHLLRVLAILFVSILLVSAAWADTLELRNGTVLNGRYLGGTQNNIRFQVDGAGSVEYYATANVLTLTFGRQDKAPLSEGQEPPPKKGALTPATQSDRLTVPAGTLITVRMIDAVDSETNKPGDEFRASLETDITLNGELVVARNSDIRGRLVEAKEAGKISGKSELKLELTDIMVDGQWQQVTTGEYEVSGKSRGSDSAKKIGGGAVIGAVVGAIAGGGKGAAIGAGVGAAAGTTIQVLTKGEQVKVPSETVLDFNLEKDLVVRVAAAKPQP